MQPPRSRHRPSAGTIFHATKLPLTGCAAIRPDRDGEERHLVGRHRPHVSCSRRAWAAEAQDHGGDGAAARGRRRLRGGRGDGRRLDLGGVRSGGKRNAKAAASAGKTPFVAAPSGISTSPEGRPRKLKLAPVKGFRKREIARGAKHWLAPGAAVVTDGLGTCWSALDEAACSHQAIRTGSGRAGRPAWHFAMGEHDVRQHQERDHRDLSQARPRPPPIRTLSPAASLALSTPEMIPTRFVHSAARTQPMPYRLLVALDFQADKQVVIRRVFSPSYTKLLPCSREPA